VNRVGVTFFRKIFLLAVGVPDTLLVKKMQERIISQKNSPLNHFCDSTSE